MSGLVHALVIADMPFMSYQPSVEMGLSNAGRFIKEAGADAVKIEGGAVRADLIEALVSNGIPVLGHIGLTPQSIKETGGYKVQGKTSDQDRRLMDDAMAVEQVGAFALVLECVPAELGEMISGALAIPTIGIGAGRGTDGQVLVWHDLLGLTPEPLPRFVRRYEDFGTKAKHAIERFTADVKDGSFPDDTESYSYPRPAEAKGA